MYKWAYDNKMIKEIKRLDGGSKWEYRKRTYTNDEMDLILNCIKPDHFQIFVRFAYYTGARRGEICKITEENLKHGYVVGKTGKRMIKLNSQALQLLDELDMYWDYKPFYITQTFKKNLRKLGIKNGRFHDLRRTFGLNLIKQGRTIYEVSKLLGHSSVRTTEKHYAPLLVSEIADFRL
jgi:integrase